MSSLKYTVCITSKKGDKFLCSVSSFCCGDRYLGYFDLQRGCAMPMNYDDAVWLRDHFRKYLGCYDYFVVPVPWNHVSTVEVSCDG